MCDTVELRISAGTAYTRNQAIGMRIRMTGTAVSTNAQDLTYCFIDTSVLLHCTTFDEVDWPQIMGVADVCLVIAGIVLKELERHKGDEKNDWRQERARTLLAKLRPYLRNPRRAQGELLEVRPHVRLLVITRAPQVDWNALGLDPGWGDDRLLATIREFQQEHPHAQVLLAARDGSLQAKATDQGLILVDEERIPEIPHISTAARELAKAQRELNELKNRMPKLRFGLWEGGQLVASVARQRRAPASSRANEETVALTNDEIASRLAAEKQQIQRAYEVGQKAAVTGSVSVSQVEEYRDRAEAYLEQLALMLPMQRSREHGLLMRLQFCLANDGTAPATAIDLEIGFPAGSFVVDAADANRDVFGAVEPPTAPTAKWMIPPRPPQNNPLFGSLRLPDYSAITSMGNSALLLPKPQYAPPPPGPRGPLYALENDRRFVWYEHTKLAQQSRWIMKPLIAYVPPDTSGGYDVEWKVRADELVKPLTGTFHVCLTEPANDESNEDKAQDTP